MASEPSGLRGRWPLLLVLLAALLARLAGLGYDMPWFVVQPDEENVVVRALRFGYGDLNPHWFLYPSLSLYAAFALYAAYYALGRVFGVFSGPAAFGEAFFNDPTVFYLLPRAVSAVTGALTAACVYFIVMELWENRRYAVLAALCLAVSPLHVVCSHSAKPDALMAFLLALGCLYSVRVYKRGGLRRSALAGLFSGLAVSAKYTAGLALFPLVLAHLLAAGEQTARKLRGLAVALCCMCAGFLIGTPYALLDRAGFSEWLGWTQAHKHILWRGHEYSWLTGYEYYIYQAWPQSLGPALFAASVCGIVWLAWKYPREALLLFSVPLVFLLYMGGASLYLANYFIPCVPFLAIAAGVFSGAAAERARPGVVRAAALAALFFPTLFMLAGRLYAFKALNTQVLAKLWIEKNVPDGARILTNRSGSPPLNLTRQRAEELLAGKTASAAPGPASGNTGRGAYYRYLAANRRFPAYYYADLPYTGARSGGGADSGFSRYKDYDYIILSASPDEGRGRPAGSPVTVPAGRAGLRGEITGRYERFIKDVEANSRLVADIGPRYYAPEEKEFPGAALLRRLFDRAGPRVRIFEVDGRRAGDRRSRSAAARHEKGIR